MSKRMWWVVALVPVWAIGLGCSDSSGSPSNATPGNSNSTGGTTPVGEHGESPSPRGVVTLLGANAGIAAGSWSFSGPASGAGEGEATVTCSLRQSGSRSFLMVAASHGGALAPAASFELELGSLEPFERALPYVGPNSQALALEVAFSSYNSAYIYGFGADAVSLPPVYSDCMASVTKLSERWVTGQLACRNLVATAESADAPTGKAPPPRASGTIAFDCPIVAKSTQPGGSGGTGGSYAAGGSSGEGGSVSNGGVNSSGSGGLNGLSGGDTGGSAGNGGSGIAKSCHGVASSCSSRSSATCTQVKGCSTSGDCRGVSSGCYSRTMYSCSSQQGCYWSSVSKNCSGSSWGCNLFSGSLSCISQDGCRWDTGCEGVATSCILLSEADCSSQPGCSWY